MISASISYRFGLHFAICNVCCTLL